MRTRLMIASAAVAALMAGAAFAQQAGDTAVNPPSSNSAPASLPTGNAAAPSSQGPASLDVTAPKAGADSVTVAPAAGAPAERAPAASVGGTDLVTNGPVPDTRENRAKYGAPMSNAGRLTKPAGN